MSLVKLDGAVRALAEARTLDEIKSIHDKAQAAAEYARAAKLGLDAQNYAAEIKLRAERKAGELLAGLERATPQTAVIMSSVGHDTEYAQVLADTDTNRQQAHRWQKIAAIPEPEFESFIETSKANGELTTHAVLRRAKELDRQQARADNAQQLQTVGTLDDIPDTFKTIVIDPPWDWGDEGDADQLGRARPTYQTMSLPELCALPVARLANENAHLYLWITNRSLPKGFALLEAWGFRYVTCLTWVKPHFGMGNYYRGQTEHLLFGVRGSLSLMRQDVGTVIHAPRGDGGHSSKPPAVYDLIESCSPGPYLDVFSRQQRRGWHTWGELGYASN